MTARASLLFGAFAAAVALVVTPAVGAGQVAMHPLLVGSAGAGATVPLAFHRGYAAVLLRTLERLGWTVNSAAERVAARHGTEGIQLRAWDPFFRWGEALLQLGSVAEAIQDPGLSGIPKELRTFDHQHCSSLLAEMVQEGLPPVHPGPNRG